MNYTQWVLAEFDAEMANTRKSLERITDDKFSWKPHSKSWSMGELAAHIANLPVWAVMTMKQGSLDLAPPDSQGQPPRPATNTVKQVLAVFDENLSSARQAISDTTDSDWEKPWTLLNRGQKVFTMPRHMVLRRFFMNHIIHHRAQIGVYLRLNDVPVPPHYGPSADEGSM